MRAVGFDFGTTNTLVSAISGGQLVTFLDEDQPIPSVVSFEAGQVVVGRKAREKMTSAGLGVQGSIVRSPKSLLGREDVIIDGVRRDPIKIVEHVLEHVRDFALNSGYAKDISLDHVVATIPVNMDGRRRAMLRQAFSDAGMSVVKFVHEPLAALYGFLRGPDAPRDAVRLYEGKLLLVFDWGGGTLDLTLCRVINGMIVQIANDGTDEVGGDYFDEALKNDVELRSRIQSGFADDVEVQPEARKRLLHECEAVKILLSTHSSRQVYVESFYRSRTAEDLQVELSKSDLERVVGHLVRVGIGKIEALLEREGFSASSVELCLATGGMVNMPLIRDRLREIFGPGRVQVSKRSSSAIAEGAAWVAHDQARLFLAKNVELALARNSYVSILDAGLEMPSEGEHRQSNVDLYCVDPSDGYGKFTLVCPNRPGVKIQSGDKRRTLCSFMLPVDASAKPFFERLWLNVDIDQDLILRVDAHSSVRGERRVAEIHDLEFGLATPTNSSSGTGVHLIDDTISGGSEPPGGLVMRSNISTYKSDLLVPGEIMYLHDPGYFGREGRRPELQISERLYYAPCFTCERRAGDPSCRCVFVPPGQLSDTASVRY